MPAGRIAVVVALYRDEKEDCAFVCFGSTTVTVPRWRYDHNKYYKIPFAELPTKAEYDLRNAPGVAA